MANKFSISLFLSFSLLLSELLLSTSAFLSPSTLSNTSISLPLFRSRNNITGFISRDIKPNNLDTPVGSGYGQYMTRIRIGSPPQPFLLAIDTGSDLSWTQCQPCVNCYPQQDPIFDPATSSTYQPLPCDEIYSCSSCSDAGTCIYKVVYGDFSETNGDLAQDTFTFGDNTPVVTYPFGCGHDNHGLFNGVSGLLGLGRGPFSLVSLIRASFFSYCLVNHDSTAESTLDFNIDHTSTGSWINTPLIPNAVKQTFYYVGLVGIAVNAEPVDIPPSTFEIDGDGNGGVIIDSGTTISLLPEDAYIALRDSFVAKCLNLGPVQGYPPFDTCFDISESTTIPTVSLLFAGGSVLPLQQFQILLRYTDSGKFCFAFAPTNVGLSIIGNTQQQGVRVSFDFGTDTIGFSPNSC